MGISPSTNYADLVKQGAIILDVRTRGEYARGHIKGSLNISVNQLKDNLSRLPDKKKPLSCVTHLE
ncbi:MAG: rhodanese-like domain-containing protein [Chryseolinea sp.]